MIFSENRYPSPDQVRATLFWDHVLARRCELVHTVFGGRGGMLAPACPPAPRRGRHARTRRGATTKGQAMSTTGATTVDADLDLDLKLGEQYYKGDKELEHKAIEDLVGFIDRKSVV